MMPQLLFSPRYTRQIPPTLLSFSSFVVLNAKLLAYCLLGQGFLCMADTLAAFLPGHQDSVENLWYTFIPISAT